MSVSTYTFKLKAGSLVKLFSLLIPILVRWIPESQFPYPIGFDTPLYFAILAQRDPPRLLSGFILKFFYTVGFDMTVVLKYLPTVLYGFLGFSLFIFSSKHLNWRNELAFIASLNLILSLPMLRISWDMHDLTVGLTLLLLTLSMLRSLDGLYERIAFFILGLTTIIAHELTAFLLLTSVFLDMVIRIRKKKGFPFYELVFLVLGSTIFLVFMYRLNVGRILGWSVRVSYEKPFSEFPREICNNVKFLVVFYLPMLPFILLGFFHDMVLSLLLGFNLIGFLSPSIIPGLYLGYLLPWRYALILDLPLSIYASRGIWRISGKISSRIRLPAAILLLLALNLPSFSFLGLGLLPSYYESPGVIPSSMVSTSIPLYDIEPTKTLLSLIDEENATIIVYGDFVGWTRYYSTARVISFGGTYRDAATLHEALNLVDDKRRLYLLWWDDNAAERLGFKPIARRGNLSLYKYEEEG